jgi:hypothetical protein
VSEDDDPYRSDIGTLVESFTSWMSHTRNQQFYSLQEAYRQWLWADGFYAIGDDYTDAVAVMLVMLSKCIVNPRDRRYLISEMNAPDEHAVLQVRVPEEDEDLTYWEFLTEANFHQMYADWRASESAR